MRKAYKRPSIRTRPPVRQDEIVEFVRGQILSGTLPPGERVPGRCELTEKYGVSNLTVQRAFDRLIAAGFVCVRPPRGTFVAEHPPHRYLYAVAIPGARTSDPPWNRFWQTLATVAQSLSQGHERRLAVYTGIDRTLSAGEDYRNLLHDVYERRLAGIVFASPPFLVDGTPIVEAPGIPRVAISAPGPERSFPTVGMPPVTTFLHKAMDYLADRGCRRLAALCHPSVHSEVEAAFHQSLGDRGLRSPAAWVQAGHMHAVEWNANLAQLLVQGRPDERPDGLVIADDNLVPCACAGIQAAGRRVPDDLQIVAHCNYPVDVRPPLPVKLLGYDVRGMLELCLGLLDDQRAGRQPVAHTTLHPLFEDELPPSA